jgi:putative pyrimidine permease RutG
LPARKHLGRQQGRLLGQPANLLVAAITLVLGTGDYTLKFGGFALGGIGTATFGAVLLHALLRRGG